MAKAEIVDMTFEDYLANSAYGCSDLMTFRAGPPAAVPHRRNNRKSTDATVIGSAAHCRILQPHLYGNTYCMKELGMKFSTKEGKAWREQKRQAGYLDENMFSVDEAETVEAIYRAFMDRTEFGLSLEMAQPHGVERVVLWTDENGLPRKAKPDWYLPSCVFDLKILRDADRGADYLARKVYWDGYLHQLASNRQGLRAAGVPVDTGRLCVICPVAPSVYRWGFEASAQLLDKIEAELHVLSADVAQCHRSGKWPGTPDGWLPLSIPNQGIEEEIEEPETEPSNEQEDDQS